MDEPKLLKTSEVAKRMRLALATVSTRCKKGTIPAVNIAPEGRKNKLWRVPREYVEAFEACIPYAPADPKSTQEDNPRPRGLTG